MPGFQARISTVHTQRRSVPAFPPGANRSRPEEQAFNIREVLRGSHGSVVIAGCGAQCIGVRHLTPDQIQKLIVEGLPGCEVEVSGDDGVHFEAIVISDLFEGKNRLARHRLVYATLGELMGNEIHALSLKTLTSAERS